MTGNTPRCRFMMKMSCWYHLYWYCSACCAIIWRIDEMIGQEVVPPWSTASLQGFKAGLYSWLKAFDASTPASACRVYFRDCPVRFRHDDNIVHQAFASKVSCCRLAILRGFISQDNRHNMASTYVQCWSGLNTHIRNRGLRSDVTWTSWCLKSQTMDFFSGL